ncbi:MAG: VanZ family protein [Desulfomonilaceae bacterium]
MRQITKYVLPLVAYCLFLFYLSSLSDQSITKIAFPDKAAHVCLYMILGFLVARSSHMVLGQRAGRHNIVVFSLLFCGIYGVSDEIHQLYVEGRSFEYGDIIADALGGALGSIFFLLIRDIIRTGRFTWGSKFL